MISEETKEAGRKDSFGSCAVVEVRGCGRHAERCPERPDTRKAAGGKGEGAPPVLIPNTEVKPFSADGTWLETARKSRSPPVPKQKALHTEVLFALPPKGGCADRADML